MTAKFYSAAGAFLGQTDYPDIRDLRIGERITASFKDQTYPEWEVIGASHLSDGVQLVILTPVRSQSTEPPEREQATR